MKTIKDVVQAVAILGFVASTVAHGVQGNITNVSFSGPTVGTSDTAIDGLTSGSLTEPRLDYGALDYIDVAITVDGPGSYLINEAPGFGFVKNHTGQTWIAFDLSVRPGSTGTFVSDWADGGNQFASISQGPLDIFFSNGSVPDGGVQFEPLGHFTTPSAGTFTVRETPSAVPEPGAFALVGLGVFGWGFVRRRTQ